MVEDSEKHAARIQDFGKKLMTLGGDNTIPYGPIRATSKKFGKLALLHFDSHQDSTLSEENEDGRRNLSHANFAYDLQEEGCCIDPGGSAQVFIRTEMTECGYNIIHSMDALDPALAPETGTPVVGGLSSDFVCKMLLGLRGINLVAADMVEVLSDMDPSNITAIAAVTICQDIMYLLYEAR